MMFEEICMQCGSPADGLYTAAGPYVCAVGHVFFQCPYCTSQSPSRRSLDWCCTETD